MTRGRSAIGRDPPRSNRRGRIAIGGAVVVAGAAAAIAALGGGGDRPVGRAVLDAAVVAEVAVDAAVIVPVAVDAHDPAEAALAEMLEANQRRDFDALLAARDRVYDATTDRDPHRARADQLIDGARPLVIAHLHGEIMGHNYVGSCDDAHRRAELTIATWGDDALGLRELARACTPVRSGDAGVRRR